MMASSSKAATSSELGRAGGGPALGPNGGPDLGFGNGPEVGLGSGPGVDRPAVAGVGLKMARSTEVNGLSGVRSTTPVNDGQRPVYPVQPNRFDQTGSVRLNQTSGSRSNRTGPIQTGQCRSTPVNGQSTAGQRPVNGRSTPVNGRPATFPACFPATFPQASSAPGASSGMPPVSDTATFDRDVPHRSFAETVRSFRPEVKRVEVAFHSDGSLIMPSEVAEEGKRLWKNTLVGYVIGRRLPVDVISRTVRLLWGKLGLVDVCGVGPGMFLMRFDSDGSFDAILERSDWHVVGIPLVLRRWIPSTSVEAFEPKLLPLWVRLKSIPVEFFHWMGVQYIASSLGVPLRMDARSFSRGSVGTARVQIEFDASVELRQSLRITDVAGQSREIQIEYEFRPPRCQSCCVFGHGFERCPRNPEATTRIERPVERRPMRGRARRSGVGMAREVRPAMAAQGTRERETLPTLHTSGEQVTIRSSVNAFQALEDADEEGEIREDVVAETSPADCELGIEPVLAEGIGVEHSRDDHTEVEVLHGDTIAQRLDELLSGVPPSDEGKRPMEPSESLESCALNMKKSMSTGFYEDFSLATADVEVDSSRAMVTVRSASADFFEGMQSDADDEFPQSPVKQSKKKSKKKVRALQRPLVKPRGASR